MEEQKRDGYDIKEKSWMRWENMMQATMHTGLAQVFRQTMIRQWLRTVQNFSVKKICLNKTILAGSEKKSDSANRMKRGNLI